MKRFIAIALLVLGLFIGSNVATERGVYAATTQEASLSLSNGGIYYGEVQDGKAHGKGTATWGKYKTYTGEWKYGKRSGKGELITTDPETETPQVIYEGTWANDKQNGQGTLREYFKFSKYSEEYDRATAHQGTFKDGQPVSGYTVIKDLSLDTELVFRYMNDNVMVALGLEDSNDLNVPLKAENMSLFASLNFKKESGFLMQYTEEKKNVYQYGTYKKGPNGGTSLFNGTIELFDPYNDKISIGIVKKAKIKSYKVVNTSEELSKYRERIIKKKLYLLDPYMSNFKKLYNQL
ncbi:hypothetical protein BK131_21190 [Paenibacillus amylolyticus]|uniref:MORN repeat-containing protein n=1 Tax=Paenibacillus amylolyticus TaxID=1451 RepID=A0A1R1BNP0_PAEAM|nr:hypothetical protein [Paenibacillus amylolyticus]OMF11467.1 hypothetical protein BK131_21190 [Paenibacillus amylolyticus]